MVRSQGRKRNPEESRAREERITLYSCRPEAWLFVVKLEEGLYPFF